MKSLFEFMAGNKTTDPGVQRHIKSTESIKDGIFDEITVWMNGREQIHGSWSPLGHKIHRENKKRRSPMQSVFGFYHMAGIKSIGPRIIEPNGPLI